MSKKCLHTLLLLSSIALIESMTLETQALPNPASQNCIAKGGSLTILKRGDGGAFGICTIRDGKQCEEWALFRGECPVGGIAIPESLTVEERYCLITGGIILDDPSQCQLPTGKICSVKDLYGGKCP